MLMVDGSLQFDGTIVFIPDRTETLSNPDTSHWSKLLGQIVVKPGALESVEANYPFMLYAHDWLAFAHLVLAILFAGAIVDPVRNAWVVKCGLIMCLLVPLLAGICIPIRGLPLCWFWIDSAFAPAAGVPLWIALRDMRRTGGELSTT